jgi:hypothetical protein
MSSIVVAAILAVDDFLLFKVFRVLEVDDFPKLLFKIEN